MRHSIRNLIVLFYLFSLFTSLSYSQELDDEERINRDSVLSIEQSINGKEFQNRGKIILRGDSASISQSSTIKSEDFQVYLRNTCFVVLMSNYFTELTEVQFTV